MPDGKPSRRDLAIPDQRRRVREEAARLMARLGPQVSRRRVADSLGLHHDAVNRHYPTDADLHYDVIDDHLRRLAVSVWEAFETTIPAGPLPALEAMVCAWLRCTQAEWHAHHALRTATHLLPAEYRETIRRNYQSLLQTIGTALAACVPAMASQPQAMDAVLTCCHRLLADISWPYDPHACEPDALGRRITGMVLAAARAELTGTWPELGGVTGLRGQLLLVETAHARARLSQVLDAVAEGGEAIITRRGRRVAKLVPAG